MAVAQLTVEEALGASVGPGRLIGDGARVLVGLSGGPDSMTLLHGLWALAEAHGLVLAACFVDHGLRPADADRAAARGLCDALGVALRVEVLEPSALSRRRELGVEGAAREARLARLEAVRGELGAERIALGHQADDQAETVLMRLLRGSATRGLGAMAPSRGVIVRPLLEVTRAEILRYVARHGLEPARDESNDDPRFLRNRIRMDLMPKLLREYNPRLVTRLTATARSLREDEALLSRMADEARRRLTRPAPGGAAHLDLAGVRALDGALRRRVLRAVLEEAPCRVSRDVLDSLAAWVERPAAAVLPLPGGLVARSEAGRLVITAPGPVPRFDATLPVGVPVRIEPLRVRVRAQLLPGPPPPMGPLEEAFPAAAVEPPLRLRQRRPGDRIEPRGMRGSRKLQDLLVDLKVPRWRRDAVLLLVDGRDRILWAVGVRRTRMGATEGEPGPTLRVTVEVDPGSSMVVIEKEGMVH